MRDLRSSGRLDEGECLLFPDDKIGTSGRRDDTGCSEELAMILDIGLIIYVCRMIWTADW